MSNWELIFFFLFNFAVSVFLILVDGNSILLVVCIKTVEVIFPLPLTLLIQPVRSSYLLYHQNTPRI